MPLIGKIPSVLSRLRPIARDPISRRCYQYLRGLWFKSTGSPISIKLHGFQVKINRGNSYPLMSREVPTFNAPIVELVLQVHQTLGRKISFVDVGAATGDTVLLVKERCHGAVGAFVCVEGDSEFFTLLGENMRQFDDVRCLKAMLSSEVKEVRSTVRHHLSSAMAIGETMVEAMPLDDILPTEAVDVLKIDVDGFDGPALVGSTKLLSRCKPAVIFEWHPALVEKAGTNPFSAFDALVAAGYRRSAWFCNTGTFSHFFDLRCRAELDQMHRYLLLINDRWDPHFDVVALPDEMKVDVVNLAALPSYYKK